jgi:hypothetical protein
MKLKRQLNCFLAYVRMSDNANLLDVTKNFKARRLMHYIVAISAASG